MHYLRYNKHTMIKLSSREKQVLKLVADKKTSKAIALELNLGLRTIHFYFECIYAKLDVSGPHARYAALGKAMELNLLD